MKLSAVLALCAAAGTACAGATFATTSTPLSVDQALNHGNRDATGDTADTVITLFSNAGGAISVGPVSHTIGGTDATTDAFGTGVSISSADVDNGNGTRTVTITWAADAWANLIPTGANIGGDPIIQIGFELGENNAGTNFVDPSLYGGLTTTDGTFDLLGSGGSVLFSGTFFTTDQGTGFSGLTFVNAGGADLSTFGIAGARATITYDVVPTPASAALLGLGGLVAARRRR